MNTTIKNLFETVEEGQEQASADAINALCSLLEKKSLSLSREESQSRYGTYVLPKVIALEINNEEEIKIIKFFQKQISKKHKHTASILFSMGKASYKIAFDPLVNTVKQHLDNFDENEVYQAIISLERIIFFDESANSEISKKILEKTKLLNHLSQKILSLEPISLKTLKNTSGRFLARMILLLDE